MKLQHIITSIFFLLATCAMGQSKLVKEKNGVKVTYTKSNCTLDKKLEEKQTQEWVLFKFTNSNDYAVKVDWDLKFSINGDCQSCQAPKGEYHRSLKLEPNEEVEGSCANVGDSRLYLFSKTINQPDNKSKLTDFSFKDFKVIKSKAK